MRHKVTADYGNKQIYFMPKEKTSFSISAQSKALLKLLSEKYDRSQADTLEQLIKEAAKKEKITLPKS